MDIDTKNLLSYEYLYNHITDIQSMLFDYKDNYRTVKFFCTSTKAWYLAPFSSQHYATEAYNMVSHLLRVRE